MPASRIPDDEELALSLLVLTDRYFTEETFEPVLIRLLNRLSLPAVGVNVWGHSSYVQIMESLKKRGAIQIMDWPWKNRISVVEKQNKC